MAINLTGRNIGSNEPLILAQNYGSTTLTAGGRPITWDQGDFTNDGAVGFPGLVILAWEWGRHEGTRARRHEAGMTR